MKKIKFEKKFSLNKETIVKLNTHQLTVLKGGATNVCPSDYATCVAGCQASITTCTLSTSPACE